MKNLLLLLALGLAGCHLNELRIYVDSDRATNGGRPMRMLVRTVESRSYVAEAYQTVAQKVVSPDESVLHTAIVYPGFPYVGWVRRGAGKSIAVYFLFTAPGSRWKMLIDQPLPYVQRIRVRANEIETADRAY